MTVSCTTAFSPTTIQRTIINDGNNIRHRSSIHHNPIQQRTFQPKLQHKQSSTSLNILGTDGGILGVGAPEIAVITLVGYFVLGPTDLYKLVKEIGKFIQNFRTLGAEAAKSFEGTMENQLELTELRKAQSELNDAFSFRRSINTNEGGEAFESGSFSDNIAAAAAESSAAVVGGVGTAVASDGTTVKIDEGTTIKKKRRLVRRKKKKVAIEPEEQPMEEINVPSESDEYPDLDMLDAVDLTEEERLRAERLDRLTAGSSSSSSDDGDDGAEPDWFKASEEDIASEVLNQQQPEPETDPALSAFERNRFQSQLSADEWNKQVMENEDELSPCKFHIFICIYLVFDCFKL